MKKDLGSKKMNNEGKVNEGNLIDNILENQENEPETLHPEIETDKQGHAKVVHRMRKTIDALSESKTINAEKALGKTIENKDRNSDITSNRYPNSHPENQENRGNIELDK